MLASTFSQYMSDSCKSIITNKLNFTSCWTPLKSETDSALKEVFIFLNSRGYNNKDINDYDLNQIPFIKNYLDKKGFDKNGYCVQFAGYSEDGKKFIRMNFFSPHEITRDTSIMIFKNNKLIIKDKSKERLYWLIDGYNYVWTITYDCIKKKCQRFFVGTVG